MRADALEAAHQDTEAGGVEELDSLHVHDELVVVLVDQVDQQLAEPRRGVYVDLALYVDDLDAVLCVVTQRQLHKILQRHAVGVSAWSRPACRPAAAERTILREFNHAPVPCLYETAAVSIPGPRVPH